MPVDTTYITESLIKNNELVAALETLFTTALADFEDIATDPGTGFDIDSWLNLVPVPTITGITIPEVSAPSTNNANQAAPSVTPPTFITPDTVATLALSQYDSQYLEDIETELRDHVDVAGSQAVGHCVGPLNYEPLALLPGLVESRRPLGLDPDDLNRRVEGLGHLDERGAPRTSPDGTDDRVHLG